MEMVKRKLGHSLLILGVSLFVLSCSGGSPETNSANANATPKKLTEVERQLFSMKTADFDYIFAIRRKDGEVFDSEDKKYVKENSPSLTNRRTFADNEKVLVVGSNYEYSKKHLDALRERFEVEDHSQKPEDKKKRDDGETSNSNQEIPDVNSKGG